MGIYYDDAAAEQKVIALPLQPPFDRIVLARSLSSSAASAASSAASSLSSGAVIASAAPVSAPASAVDT
jgi:hypothetical protein